MRTPQYMATCLLNIPSLPITMRKMTIYSPLSTSKTSGKKENSNGNPQNKPLDCMAKINSQHVLKSKR